jgi:hypothetical protein
MQTIVQSEVIFTFCVMNGSLADPAILPLTFATGWQRNDKRRL